MKKTSKVIVILTILSICLSAISITSFAWQTNNDRYIENAFSGTQSYALFPLSSMYFTRATNDYVPSTYQERTFTFNNVYNVGSKSNFNVSGKPLTETKWETLNSWNKIGFGPYTDWNNISSEYKQSLGYLTDRVSSFDWGTDQFIINPYYSTSNDTINGAVFDQFTYHIHPMGIYYEDPMADRMGVNIEFADFVLSKNMFGIADISPLHIDVIQYYTGENFTPGNIKYDLYFEVWDYWNDNDQIIATYNGQNRVRQTEGYNWQGMDGRTYDGQIYQLNVLEEIWNEIQFEEQTGDEIVIRNLKFVMQPDYSTQYSSESFLELKLKQTFLRPFATHYKNAYGDWEADLSTMKTAPYTWLQNIDEELWNAFGEREIVIAYEEFENLGNAIGNTVYGVLNIPIFGSITLWHIALIPFAIGLIYAVMKFFRGG